MGTYNHKQILQEYANGRMSVEMTLGHILQHLDKLYQLQATANTNRYELRGRVDAMERTMANLQTDVARLAAHVKAFRANQDQTDI